MMLYRLMLRLVLSVGYFARALGGTDFFSKPVELFPYSVGSYERCTFLGSADSASWHRLEHELDTYTAPEQKHFVILVASYNNRDFYQANLSSIIAQDYDNYSVLYANDCSTDGTADLVQAYITAAGAQHRFTLLSHQERMFGLQAFFDAVAHAPQNSIIVTLDGDDAFAHAGVLKYLNKLYCLGDPAYASYRAQWIAPDKKFFAYFPADVWMICGSSVWIPDWTIRMPHPIPHSTIASGEYRSFYTTHRFGGFHTRSFYTWLLASIKQTDLLHHNQLPPMGYDVGLVIALLERSGGRFFFSRDVTYCYNKRNPTSDSKVNRQLQEAISLYYKTEAPVQQPLAHKPL